MKGMRTMYDLQKASMWKRISAALFDAILLFIAIVGFAFLLSSVMDYDSRMDGMKACYARFEEEHGVQLDITAEKYNALSAEEKERYDEASRAFSKDEEVITLYGQVLTMTLLIVTFSVLLACLLLEFFIPLLFKNGQTLGKKIFSIGVMRVDGVRLTPLQLFVRTVLGKYTVELMLPIMLLLMIAFNLMGIIGYLLIVAILLTQVILLIVTPTRAVIHDKLAFTVTVDMASQMIFDSPEALLEYKKRVHAEASGLRKD